MNANIELTPREINEIVVATFRAHRRHNERLIGSMEAADRCLTAIRQSGYEPSAREWALTECVLDGVGGQNLTMPGVRAYANIMAEREGYSAELNDIVNDAYYGYIWLFSDAITLTILAFANDLNPAFTWWNPDYAQYARHCGESMAEYAQRITLFILCHERRHSCQDMADMIADYDNVTTDNLYAVHDQLACEIDANNFGTYHTSGEYGMYRDAF